MSSSEKVSLLSLKNDSMLSYIGGLLTVLRGRLGQHHEKDKISDSGFNSEDIEKGRMICIEDRVVLERGVKPLEKKLEYQLSKLVRAYLRMEKEYNDAKERATRNESDSGSEEDEEEEEDEDENLAYRPNLIVSKASGKVSRSTKDEKEEDQGEESDESSEDAKDKNTALYKPPKIDAVLPPSQLTTHTEDRLSSRDRRDRRHVSRMQAMEEYIREQSDQPDWGTSIGANIVDHGRGGIKSLQESERERRITNYEEENFTRLNHMGMSKAERRKQKQKERAARINTIGGEDFSIFSSKRRFEDSTSRRSNKKPKTAWDRAKRKL